jgi:peptidyl-dipeptidase Dcp
MPAALVEKLRKADTFNQGYSLTEMLAASELDMQWHLISPGAAIPSVDDFERAALEKTKLDMKTVPPRYRTSYFSHIWSSGYSAGYYAYLWSEMLDDDAWQWFTRHGGPTRENGDRFRKMVLSQGSKQDFEKMYEAWRGAPPSTDAMIHERGLK